MSSNSEISHRGRIVEITPSLTSVEIISESACSACHARGMCELGGLKTKLVQVPTRGWDNFQVGDEVEVVLTAAMGHAAVMLAYVAPLIVLVAVLLTLTFAGVGELTAGLCSLGAVALWYGVLWLMRDRLKKDYIFKINR